MYALLLKCRLILDPEPPAKKTKLSTDDIFDDEDANEVYKTYDESNKIMIKSLPRPVFKKNKKSSTRTIVQRKPTPVDVDVDVDLTGGGNF